MDCFYGHQIWGFFFFGIVAYMVALKIDGREGKIDFEFVENWALYLN